MNKDPWPRDIVLKSGVMVGEFGSGLPLDAGARLKLAFAFVLVLALGRSGLGLEAGNPRFHKGTNFVGEPGFRKSISISSGTIGGGTAGL